MDENTFYLRIWRLIAAMVCVLILSISGCSMYDSRILAQMIKNGADPIAARCALGVSSSTAGQTMCMAHVLKGAK